jgi:hypothetical protein
MFKDWRMTIDPPGEPGHKVDYFYAKPRHRVVVPILVLSGLALTISAILTSQGTHPETALLVGLLALVQFVSAAISWRVGKHQAERLKSGTAASSVPQCPSVRR